MEVLSWIYSFMGGFGLLNKPTKILILGLDKAGKSTLLMQMAYNRREDLQSTTLNSTPEELVVHNARFVATNFGDYQHVHDVAGIILVVDVADYQRFVQVKAELDALLATKEMHAVPIVVLGNKMDSLYAVSEEELRYELGLERICGQPIELYMCSLDLRQGYGEALRWLAGHV
ncbi:small COPII coat GTPase sar1 [Xylaria castorea]|nr:small COPII coat GTPase sar1 [Xylaria castorea]